MHKIEILMLQLLRFGLALSAECNLLSQKAEMRVVTQESQHDQIGIETVQTMSNVWIIIGLGLGQSNILHDLMFPPARDFMPRQNDLTTLPVHILGHLLI